MFSLLLFLLSTRGNALLFGQIPAGVAAASNSSQVCNPKDFGAVGDGSHDDTSAFNATIGKCVEGGTPVLYIPSGFYVISSPLLFQTALPLTIKGDGYVSNLLWTANSDLFLWNTSVPTVGIVIENLAISSVGAMKSEGSTALHFTAGAVKSNFDTLIFYGDGGPVVGTWQPTLSGTNMDLGYVTDTVSGRA